MSPVKKRKPWRRTGWTRSAGLGLAALLVLGCASAPPPSPAAPAAPAAPAEDPSQFSSGRAWRHLESLTRIGERQTGSRGARRTRAYFARELDRSGIEASEQTYEVESQGKTVELTHTIGVLPGESSDVILLAAHYDTPDLRFRFVGANDGGSGPAMLLELARVLALEPRRYTIWLVFLDGEMLGDREHHLGAHALAAHLVEQDRMAQIRMAVFFNQIADPELELERDLRSHRSYRELFWDSASALGHTGAFPALRKFASPSGGHEAFLARGLRPVVAIVDDRFGGATPPGLYARTKQDDLPHCSQRSLGIVGEVTQEAIARLETRLVQIDRFASSPLESDPAFGAFLAPSTHSEGDASTSDAKTMPSEAAAEGGPGSDSEVAPSS